jgi:hypothetical protein
MSYASRWLQACARNLLNFDEATETANQLQSGRSKGGQPAAKSARFPGNPAQLTKSHVSNDESGSSNNHYTIVSNDKVSPSKSISVFRPKRE